ncbi:AMP-binding enzyme [Eremomyces bilateralis CBS 781.70]|uniref:AMP-binding enzyme n=1 Tax=Eremomyces bilateralis CBS 781.70 TaxID=1392243 RepID=A0A6G1G8H1_9PEZI|nr:AMP-binding enzyme [Eremomyces bilateralis CBS 781.70]KAF1814368.1 AMP-binding enzyme [Eremomyces bilateralis CBS 781.70]
MPPSAERAISVPNDLNLTELLHTSARNDLPESHLISRDCLTGRTLSIGQLRDRAGRFASGFKQRFNPPDQSRWAIIVPNCVEYIELFHAVLWVGGVACPINHALKAAEIAHALTVSKPHVILVYGQVLPTVLDAIRLAQEKGGADFDVPELVTVLGKSATHPDVEGLLGEGRLDVPHYKDTKTRLASIHLSSGTTGNPKGVALTHFNYVANVLQLHKHDPDHWTAGDRIVSYTPFVHIANTTIPLFLGPWCGVLHCIMPSYDLETFGKMVQDNKATAAQAVGTVALALANSDVTKRYDFSSVRYLVCGGLPVEDATYQRLLSKGNWKTIMLYGMTEAAPFVVYQKQRQTVPLGQLGNLLPGIEAVLRADNGSKDAPAGGPGEMWLRGPNLTSGYIFNEEATRNAFKGDGWYNTGDVCTFSKEGYLSVVGRTKELVKYKGFQVSPTELETYMTSHPDIAEAAVGSVWDQEQLTELPTAYVVLKEHVRTREEKVKALQKIRQLVDSKVSGYKKLRGGVHEVTVLPRNAQTKILRKQLADNKTGIRDPETPSVSRSKI